MESEERGRGAEAGQGAESEPRDAPPTGSESAPEDQTPRADRDDAVTGRLYDKPREYRENAGFAGCGTVLFSWWVPFALVLHHWQLGVAGLAVNGALFTLLYFGVNDSLPRMEIRADRLRLEVGASARPWAEYDRDQVGAVELRDGWLSVTGPDGAELIRRPVPRRSRKLRRALARHGWLPKESARSNP